MAQTHDPFCPNVGEHSDAAKAASDAVNLHVSAIGFAAVHKWVAVSLETGKSDGVLYDSMGDAVRHQKNERGSAYICIAPNGMSVCEAKVFLDFHRQITRNGASWIDPDDRRGGKLPIPRLTREQQMRQLSALLS